MELVSVIITTYNRNDKFERALKSVLNQNYPNIEIIIVNDYPGDDYELVKIINKYRFTLSKNPPAAYCFQGFSYLAHEVKL